METNKNLYVLIFQIPYIKSAQLEKLWYTGFDGSISKWEYSRNAKKKHIENAELHSVYYKYYKTYNDAKVDLARVAQDTVVELFFTINPKMIEATHYISISLENYYGYLYDVGSSFNLLLEERIELNTI
jgi:hypothetical protein